MNEHQLLKAVPESKTTRPPKHKAANPIDAALQAWLDSLPTDILALVPPEIQDIKASGAPKRWVVYPPMVLLPSGSFEQSWWKSLPGCVSQHIDSLWRMTLEHIGKREGKGLLTHLATNAGIPLNKSEDEDENVLRTPSGLLMHFGDFGPALDPAKSPSETDFAEAFWVSTKQNGITQIWAPRYTMFSRGNIKEKARILNFHNDPRALKYKSRSELSKETAVDLYAGIGYFVFSYVKMGMKRVFGWELNPWSVEGLRRGALANGWTVKVVREGDILTFKDENIVVLLEDNMKAARRLKVLREKDEFFVSHVNCGLLPSSEASWETALEVLDQEGWLHLHENVGVADIANRKSEIEDGLQRTSNKYLNQRRVKADEVELVKTFAPGVWHCVFDVYISSSLMQH